MRTEITSLSYRRRAVLVFNGGLMFALGLAIGFVFTFAIIGHVEAWPLIPPLDISVPGSAQAWRQTHLSLLFNAITVFAISACGKHILLGNRAQNILVICVVATGWFNIAGFITGALYGVHGVLFDASLANRVTYLFFLVAVVTAIIETGLIVTGAWRAMRSIGLR